MARRADKSAGIIIFSSPKGDIAFTLIHRYHQKHINIRITHGGEVKVSAPYGSSMTNVLNAVGTKEQWIRSHIRKMGALLEAFNPEKTVLFQGSEHDVKVVMDPTRAGVVRLLGDELHIRTRSPESVDSTDLIGKWLRRQARALIQARVEEISVAIGIPCNTVFVRNQRSRWGSSSSKGNISLNWRAVMLPGGVSDYLIIHELAHQRFLDHSGQFWGLVEKLCPDYRTHESYLKRHSTLLALFR